METKRRFGIAGLTGIALEKELKKHALNQALLDVTLEKLQKSLPLGTKLEGKILSSSEFSLSLRYDYQCIYEAKLDFQTFNIDELLKKELQPICNCFIPFWKGMPKPMECRWTVFGVDAENCVVRLKDNGLNISMMSCAWEELQSKKAELQALAIKYDAFKKHLEQGLMDTALLSIESVGDQCILYLQSGSFHIKLATVNQQELFAKEDDLASIVTAYSDFINELQKRKESLCYVSIKEDEDDESVSVGYECGRIKCLVKTFKRSELLAKLDEIVADTVNAKEICDSVELQFKNTKAGETEAVDLGLPSGTKWANCNIGAETPFDQGDYYAWGSLKSDFCDIDNIRNFQTENRIIDKRLTIAPEDDIATQRLGNGWRIPTEKNMQELIDNCYVSDFNYVKSISEDPSDKVFGVLFVSKINGKAIFLPETGIPDYSYSMSHCNYWTSDGDESGNAVYLGTFDDNLQLYSQYKELVVSVRGVFL